VVDDSELDYSMREADVALPHVAAAPADLVARPSDDGATYHFYCAPEYLKKTARRRPPRSSISTASSSMRRSRGRDQQITGSRGRLKPARAPPILQVNNTYGLLRAVAQRHRIAAMDRLCRRRGAGAGAILRS